MKKLKLMVIFRELGGERETHYQEGFPMVEEELESTESAWFEEDTWIFSTEDTQHASKPWNTLMISFFHTCKEICH